MGAKQKLFDSVGMKKIMQREMAKHDEHGVLPVFAMLRRARPLCRGQLCQPRHKAFAIEDESVNRRREIHVQKEVVGILIPGRVGADDRRRLTKHVLEALEEKAMDMGEVTEVFVR